MAAAHGQLLANDALASRGFCGLAQINLHPSADCIAIGPALRQTQLQPASHRQRLFGGASAHIAP